MTSWCSRCPRTRSRRAERGDPRRHGARRRAGGHAQRAARRRDRHRAELGRRALTGAQPAPDQDIAALAKGGRTNFLGFLLRLAARLPFLFIAGRFYGAELLGRFAYAVHRLEFAAQLATLGLKRGLAQQLSTTDQPHVCVVADALLVGLIASAIASAMLDGRSPGDVPRQRHTRRGMAAAAGDLRHRRRRRRARRARLSPQCRARPSTSAPIVEPWTISIAAGALVLPLLPRRADHRLCASRSPPALAAALWRLFRSYGRAARLAAASGRACGGRAAQRAARRRRRDRMGLAPARHRDPRPVLRAGCGRRLLCRAAGRLAAAEAEDQLRSDPRARSSPRSSPRATSRRSPGRSARSASGSSPRRRRSRSRSAFRARR